MTLIWGDRCVAEFCRDSGEYLRERPFYRIVRGILLTLGRALYRPQIVGTELVPAEGGVVLAGNHTSKKDWILHIMALKRQVHFLGKRELHDGKLGALVDRMGVIPVNRAVHDRWALDTAILGLREGKVIAVFPESTINLSDDVTLPFKIGAVKMAAETGAPLIPFTITGRFRIFRKGPTLTFWPPVYPDPGDLDEANRQFMELIRTKLTEARPD